MPTNSTAPRPRSELIARNRHPRRRVDLALLRRITRAALEDAVFLSDPRSRAGGNAGAPAAARRPGRPQACPPLQFELGCDLVDASEIAALNERHLGHVGATDVISFEYGPPPGVPPEAPWLRGEVFVCLDVARTQARQFRTTWTKELVRYVVHGLLHIRGYDDLTTADRRVMKREEDRLVAALGRRFAFHQLARRRPGGRPGSRQDNGRSRRSAMVNPAPSAGLGGL